MSFDTKKWDGVLYDDAQSYVSQKGLDLLDVMPAGTGLRVLDLGCGTGDLTQALYQCGHEVVGLDSSEEMLACARQKYPHLSFQCLDALQLDYKREYDVVFSNAMFHWVQDQRALLLGIYRSLRKGGCLVCEFGAQGNVSSIVQAFSRVLQSYGVLYQSPFYFPDAASYEQLLLSMGFDVRCMKEFDRPTVLPDGENGLKHWMKQFFSEELAGFDSLTQDSMMSKVEHLLRESCFKDGAWVADYRRLRLRARK